MNSKKVYNDGFPDIWWQEIPKDKLAWWEFSASSVSREKGEVMLSKRNELGKLSNFTAAKFELDGVQYNSIEGLWQGMKYPEGKNDPRLKDKSIKWPYTRDEVMKMTAFEAKHAGDLADEINKKLGINWITYKGKKIDYMGKDQKVHYDLIVRASRAKVEANPDIKEMLLRTKNLKFFPDHAQSPNDPPAWRYFEIYMKLRDEYLAKG